MISHTYAAGVANPAVRTEEISGTLKTAYVLGLLSKLLDGLFYLAVFRLLSVAEVASFSFAMACAAFVAFALDLGATPALIRLLASNSPLRYVVVRAALGFRLIAASAGILGLTCSYILGYVRWSETTLLIPVLVIQLMLSLEQVPLAFLRAQGRQGAVNVIGTVESFLRLAALTCVALSGQAAAGEILIALAIVQVGVSAFVLSNFWAHQRREGEHVAPSLSQIGSFFSISRPFLLISACAVVQNRMDWLLLSSLSNASDLAGYSLANKLYELQLLFFGIAISTIYPWMCDRSISHARAQRLSLLLELLALAGTACGWIGFSVMPWVATAALGEKYASSAALIRGFAALSGFAILVALTYTVLIARNLEKSLWRTTAVATVALLVIDLVTIPKWGAMGAFAGMVGLVALTLLGYNANLSGTNAAINFNLPSCLLRSAPPAAVALIANYLSVPVYLSLLLVITASALTIFTLPKEARTVISGALQRISRVKS